MSGAVEDLLLTGWGLCSPAGVIVGITFGLCLRPLHLSPDAIQVAAFPGEIMLRLLKMLVLPLIAGSMVAGRGFPAPPLKTCCWKPDMGLDSFA